MVPCPSLSSPANPLRGSGVSDRSRCGAVPMLERFRRRGEGGGGERGEERGGRRREGAGRREEEGGGRREEGDEQAADEVGRELLLDEVEEVGVAGELERPRGWGRHQGLEASVGWVRKPAPAMASSISVWVRELVQYCRKVRG